MRTLPKSMKAMVTMDHGAVDQMVLHHDWPRPDPAYGEVLLQVKPYGLNSTDVKTRSGWYSKAVTEASTGGAFDAVDEKDPTWGAAPITFPCIQDADVCAVFKADRDGADPSPIGEDVISDNWLHDLQDPDYMGITGYCGTERDGGFAQFTTIPEPNAVTAKSSLTEAEMATFSCSYSIAEGVFTRAKVTERDTVLVTGASGGVGAIKPAFATTYPFEDTREAQTVFIAKKHTGDVTVVP